MICMHASVFVYVEEVMKLKRGSREGREDLKGGGKKIIKYLIKSGRGGLERWLSAKALAM